MGIKTTCKHSVLGPPGVRPRSISRGLLKGLRFHVDTAVMSQRLLGTYESEIAGHVRRLTNIARSAVDVGANDGWYSLYFASRPQMDVVVAVDANENMQKNLEANFALNDPSYMAKVTCRAEFVGAEDSDSTISLDTLTADLPRPVLVKIDVDGGELDVLRGATRLIVAGEAIFVVETHSKELEDDCLSFLKEQGYNTTVIKNAWYRAFLPEQRPIAHNRWFLASHSRVDG